MATQGIVKGTSNHTAAYSLQYGEELAVGIHNSV